MMERGKEIISFVTENYKTENLPKFSSKSQ